MADHLVVKKRTLRLAIRALATIPLIVLLGYAVGSMFLIWAGTTVPHAFHQMLVGVSIATGICVYALLFAWAWDGFEPNTLDECPHAIPACDYCKKRILSNGKMEPRPPVVPRPNYDADMDRWLRKL